MHKITLIKTWFFKKITLLKLSPSCHQDIGGRKTGEEVFILILQQKALISQVITELNFKITMGQNSARRRVTRFTSKSWEK